MAIGKDGAVVRQLRTLFKLGTIRDLTDGQLLELFATERGEAAELAFAALVERHGPMVLRVCRGVLNNPHDSQDAFQATFLVLVKKARGLWVRDSLGPWLHQVALRTASCARSSAARRVRHERRASQLRKEGFTVVDDDLGRVLHEEIDRLPERFRAPVILCDLQGRSHEQAARHLGWPIGTVKSRQARGRERLRHRLERRGLGPNLGLMAPALEAGNIDAVIPPALVDSTARTALEYGTIHTFLRGSAATLAQGVLRSMAATRYLRAVTVLVVLGVTVSGAGWLAQRGTTPAIAEAQQNIRVPRGAALITYSVKPGPLVVKVIGPGSLEPARTFDAYCQVEATVTIISIKPEGSAVKKGELVCELYSPALRDRLTNQQLAEKQSELESHRAEFARETAELALREYVEGTLPHERNRLNAEIRLARSAIEKAESSLKRARAAHERLKGAVAARGAATTPADIAAELDIEDRRDAADQTIEREKKALEQATAQLELLERYTSSRTTRELKIAVELKGSDERAKKAAGSLATGMTRKLERQLQYCTIYAQGDGLLIYANDPRFPNRPPAIERGATVRERQKIFSVFDLKSPLRVNAKIAEAVVDKLATGMQARIRVNAFPDQIFTGKVTEVMPLPDPTTFFSDDRKVYTTHVLVQDGIPALRPGMNAQVEIVVKELDKVLAVPVAAVLHYDGEHHLAVKKPDAGIAWRVVQVGAANERFVEIKEGLERGDEVVVNPLVLMTEDEKRAKFGKPTEPAKAAEPANRTVPSKGKGKARPPRERA